MFMSQGVKLQPQTTSVLFTHPPKLHAGRLLVYGDKADPKVASSYFNRPAYKSFGGKPDVATITTNKYTDPLFPSEIRERSVFRKLTITERKKLKEDINQVIKNLPASMVSQAATLTGIVTQLNTDTTSTVNALDLIQDAIANLPAAMPTGDPALLQAITLLNQDINKMTAITYQGFTDMNSANQAMLTVLQGPGQPQIQGPPQGQAPPPGQPQGQPGDSGMGNAPTSADKVILADTLLQSVNIGKLNEGRTSVNAYVFPPSEKAGAFKAMKDRNYTEAWLIRNDKQFKSLATNYDDVNVAGVMDLYKISDIGAHEPADPPQSRLIMIPTVYARFKAASKLKQEPLILTKFPELKGLENIIVSSSEINKGVYKTVPLMYIKSKQPKKKDEGEA